MPSPTIAELAARLDAIEGLGIPQHFAAIDAKLAVPAPHALVPPITVGVLTNVPAPGSQLAAQWAQDASGMLLQRFPTTAALQAWAAPNGAYAVAVDTGIIWRRITGVWSQFSPWIGTATGVGIAANNPPGVTVVNSLNIPADPGPRTAVISCFLRIDAYYDIDITVDLFADGNLLGRSVTSRSVASPDLYPTWNIGMIGTLNLRANVVTPVQVQCVNPGVLGSVFMTFGQAYSNRIDVTVHPR